MRGSFGFGMRDPNASYKELKPLNSYDIMAYESWLEHMAVDGWQLREFSGKNGVFLPAEPRKCRYRMQLAAHKEAEPRPEKVESWGALGWEYVTSIAGRFHVWRSEGTIGPELSRTDGLRPEDFRKIRRKILSENGLCSLLFSVFIILIGGSTFFWGRAPVWNMVYDEMPGENLLLGLMIFGGLIWSVYEMVQAMRVLRTLEEREPLRHEPNAHRRQKWLARGAWLVGILVITIGLAGMKWAQPWNVHGETIDVPPEEAVFVDLRVMDRLEEENTYFFATETKVHELAPRMWFVRQYGDFGERGEDDLVAHSEYYHLISKYLVPQLAQDLLEMHGGKKWAVQQETTELDEFWWKQLQGEQANDQYIVAVLGRNVLGLYYRGETDLRAQEAYFAQLLREAQRK